MTEIQGNVQLNNDINLELIGQKSIRRSSRKSKRSIKKEEEENILTKILNKCEDGLKVVHMGEKGRGVMAVKEFKKGDFIVEYAGELINISEAKQREEKYANDQDKGCYMYYFNCNNRKYCIDATDESGRLGRLVNHSKTKCNSRTRLIVHNDFMYLILVASRDISIGEELLYDYGDRNQETLISHPWLKS
ncbi:N-lysine methyltransferase KMT5A-like [Mercenaria mercenaria]|uniref:N-lysine methyltransferase KMT5A-like n=1 Tax=Mercenaria mercenaria TaxID=6596 RepID=UPI00234FACC9|nr:N-lysine methyltransferase KMT5A-like [Mercenaria mercenaria]